MRLRIKKANDTKFASASRYKREYEDVLVEAVNTLPEEFEKFDIVPSTENKANLVVYNYETEKIIKVSDLNDEIDKFLNLINKELNKKDLIITMKKDSDFFKVFTKEEYAAMKEREKEVIRQQQVARTKREQSKAVFDLAIENMVREMSEQFGDFITWQDPPYRENRDGRITPSFRYNRDNPDFNDDVPLQVREYTSNLNITKPDDLDF